MNKNTFKQYREANRKRQTGKKWNTDLSLEDSVTSMTINLQPIRCLEIVRTMEIRKQIHSDHKINYIWQVLLTVNVYYSHCLFFFMDNKNARGSLIAFANRIPSRRRFSHKPLGYSFNS
ncbi:hypothetical protein RclHR1_00380030 [Rhizophagus clarus]|uniref:Uncharacterized protein n=1 Tax=Rhizophagus clarus TaxID=94130 RepID=A0A2Z6RUM7_9GLOM|nr:hypothetical protein RclHR1_00380030 [Rhizophagus clarus]